MCVCEVKQIWIKSDRMINKTNLKCFAFISDSSEIYGKGVMACWCYCMHLNSSRYFYVFSDMEFFFK